MVEQQTPNLMVGGSSPSWPANRFDVWLHAGSEVKKGLP